MGKYHTKHPSISEFVFSGTYHSWDGFENEVRKNFLAQQWGHSIISVRRSRPDPADLANEMFLVGDELSLSGRFVQHVLHVMTAVGHDLRIPIRFGDHKIVNPSERERGLEEFRRQSAVTLLDPSTGEKKRPNFKQTLSEDPDYAAVDFNERARFIGEIKTPWTQDFENLRKDDKQWRRHLGQIANYMKVYNLKYGFWTSYEQTVFLKQEQSQTGQWTLRISNIIKFDKSSNLKLDPKGNLRDSVSVRECMLYLMCITSGPLKNSKVSNDDDAFVHGKKGLKRDQTNPNSATVLPKKTIGVKPNSKASEQEVTSRKQAYDRDQRLKKRAANAPGSGAPLQPLRESSQNSSLRRPSASQDQTGSKPSSRTSSTTRTPRTRNEGKDKQRAMEISPERRISSSTEGTSEAGQQEEARARSTSSQRSRIQPQEQQGSQSRIESEDLYGASDDENSAASRALSYRGRSDQRQPLPQQPSAPAVSVQSTQSSGQRATAPTSAPRQSSTQASTQQQGEPSTQQQGESSTRRSTRRRPQQQQQQQQQQEPRSPGRKLMDKFRKR